MWGLFETPWSAKNYEKFSDEQLDLELKTLHSQLEQAKKEKERREWENNSEWNNNGPVSSNEISEEQDDFKDENLDKIQLYGWWKRNVLTKSVLKETIQWIKYPYRSEISSFINNGNDIEWLQEYLNDKIRSGEINMEELKKSLKRKGISFKKDSISVDWKLWPQTIEAIKMLRYDQAWREARVKDTEAKAAKAKAEAAPLIYSPEHKAEMEKKAAEAEAKAAEARAAEAEAAAAPLIYSPEYKAEMKKKAEEERKKAEEMKKKAAEAKKKVEMEKKKAEDAKKKAEEEKKAKAEMEKKTAEARNRRQWDRSQHSWWQSRWNFNG